VQRIKAQTSAANGSDTPDSPREIELALQVRAVDSDLLLRKGGFYQKFISYDAWRAKDDMALKAKQVLWLAPRDSTCSTAPTAQMISQAKAREEKSALRRAKVAREKVRRGHRGILHSYGRRRRVTQRFKRFASEHTQSAGSPERLSN
jgi:uncharacterized protein YecT (DUF1311 family)